MTPARFPFPLLLAAILCALSFAGSADAVGFGAYLADITPEQVFPGADRFGPLEGNPPAQTVYKGDQEIGYVFETSDIGYSGKPIKILVGMDKAGIITGAKVTEHHEPILLVGIPPEKLTAFVDAYVGRNLIEETRSKKQQVDAISGATVTAIVINDGLTRTALRLARAHGLAGFEPSAASGSSQQAATKVLASNPFQPAGWQDLLGDGSVQRLHLLNSDVDAAFKAIGVGSPEPYAKAGNPSDNFIDLYLAPVSVESIGRNLIGKNPYRILVSWLKPGQQAILIAASGDYSFRGSGFVRGGIFDRFQLMQGDRTVLFKDKDYRHLNQLADGFPAFNEIGLFRIPESAGFDPVLDWRIELLAQRPIGPTEKAFISFPLSYHLPDRFVTAAPAATPAADGQAVLGVDDVPGRSELWKKIWLGRSVDIAILTLSLVILTMIFFFQDVLVKKPRLFTGLRVAYLLFSVIFIGGWAQAQLSVVNVFTFTGALMSGFRWDAFLLEPLIFILWGATAVSLLFWGRGPFCGWLCPFGSLQELLNHLGRRLGIRQITIPFHWHERLWPLKYMIFLGLFGLSLSEIALAERFAEVEPFKTAVLLRFAREWPFVLYAVALLVAGLFVERFFCRYLCPLGAALAIPGRMRLFEWLKRRKQCGFECQLCANKCTVQAIHPLGQINPNECIYCMQCQVIYWDQGVCPPLVLKRTGRGKKHPAGQATGIPVATPSVTAE